MGPFEKINKSVYQLFGFTNFIITFASLNK